MSIFYRYVRLHEINSIWTSGFACTPMQAPHGEYSAIGEFRCCK